MVWEPHFENYNWYITFTDDGIEEHLWDAVKHTNLFGNKSNVFNMFSLEKKTPNFYPFHMFGHIIFFFKKYLSTIYINSYFYFGSVYFVLV